MIDFTCCEHHRRVRQILRCVLALAACTAACGQVSVGDLQERSPQLSPVGGSSGFVAGAGGAAPISVAGAVAFVGTAGISMDAGQAATAGPAQCDTTTVEDPIVANCPAIAPNNGDSCAGAVENGICVWQTSLESGKHQGYYAAGCYQWLQGKVWWGVTHTQNEAFHAEDAECPTHAPMLGDSCSTQNLKVCLYPSLYCECRQNPKGLWLCTDGLSGTVSPPIAIHRQCVPQGIDETKRIKDLTTAEASAWCEWGNHYSHQGQSYLFAGAKRQFPTDVDLALCVGSLSVGDCAKNLRTQPCTATLAELDDCVQTVLVDAHDETLKSPVSHWVGHGCAPLLNNPTCKGIVVQPWHLDQQFDECVTPLE